MVLLSAYAVAEMLQIRQRRHMMLNILFFIDLFPSFPYASTLMPNASIWVSVRPQALFIAALAL